MITKSKWPDEPESSETIRRLNWFMEVGFVVEKIDFAFRQRKTMLTGDCVPDDIGMEHTEGGPFRIVFSGIRNFAVQNMHQMYYEERLLLKSPREFTIEKDLSYNRYYHLKTSSLNDHIGFEIDFEELKIHQVNK